jgi:hypothetical protein
MPADEQLEAGRDLGVLQQRRLTVAVAFVVKGLEEVDPVASQPSDGVVSGCGPLL